MCILSTIWQLTIYGQTGLRERLTRLKTIGWHLRFTGRQQNARTAFPYSVCCCFQNFP